MATTEQSSLDTPYILGIGALLHPDLLPTLPPPSLCHVFGTHMVNRNPYETHDTVLEVIANCPRGKIKVCANCIQNKGALSMPLC